MSTDTIVAVGISAIITAIVTAYQLIRVARIKAKTDQDIEAIRAQNLQDIEKLKSESQMAIERLKAEQAAQTEIAQAAAQHKKTLSDEAFRDYREVYDHLKNAWKELQIVKDAIASVLNDPIEVNPVLLKGYMTSAANIFNRYTNACGPTAAFLAAWCTNGE